MPIVIRPSGEIETVSAHFLVTGADKVRSSDNHEAWFVPTSLVIHASRTDGEQWRVNGASLSGPPLNGERHRAYYRPDKYGTWPDDTPGYVPQRAYFFEQQRNGEGPR